MKYSSSENVRLNLRLRRMGSGEIHVPMRDWAMRPAATSR
jgi:hypothetical protein